MGRYMGRVDSGVALVLMEEGVSRLSTEHGDAKKLQASKCLMLFFGRAPAWDQLSR
jgi:hypothetical protein